MDDDCFLPGLRREISPLARAATLSADYGDASDLLNGIDCRIWGRDNGYFGKTGAAITYTFDKPTFVNGFRLVVDSDLDRENFDGAWHVAYETADNHQRLVRGDIGRECLAIRLIPLSTWGSELKTETYGSATAHIFAFEPV